MAMFDSARIRSTSATIEAGYAGAEGTVFGITTVSVTGVEVIGLPEDDCAINVDFDGAMPSAWFQPSFVEITSEPALTLSVGDVSLRRDDAGEWTVKRAKPWWAFWR